MKSDKTSSPPLFMVAQLPFNTEEAVKLNAPMAEVMNDEGNLEVSITNLKELGVWKDVLQAKTRFLEIGCGRGYLINKLYKEGRGEYLGTEPIVKEYQIAIDNLLQQLGDSRLNPASIQELIKPTILENTNFKKEYFDYIYSYHVFEHLENPLLMLEYGKEWLKPGGKIIITCPNVEGYFPSKNLSNWRCAITAHRWLPGLSTLCRALEYSGYRIEARFTYGGFPATRSIMDSVFNWWAKKTKKGDVMCVMAVKDL